MTRRALAAAGVMFIDENGVAGPGVRLRKPQTKKRLATIRPPGGHPWLDLAAPGRYFSPGAQGRKRQMLVPLASTTRESSVCLHGETNRLGRDRACHQLYLNLYN